MYGTDTVQIQTELTEILTSRARAHVGDECGQAASCRVEEGRQDTGIEPTLVYGTLT